MKPKPKHGTRQWKKLEKELKTIYIWLHWRKGQLIIDADTEPEVLAIFFEEVAKFVRRKYNDK